jgi:hypothetical protein
MSTTDWRAVEVALAPRLKVAVSVDLGGEEAFAQSIAHVFVDPPASVEPGDLPCILLGDSPFDDEWDSALALETYALECFLMLRDEDAEVAQQLTKAYRQSLRDALRANVKVGRSDTTLQGASFGPIAAVTYAGRDYLGFRFNVDVVLNDENPGFAAGEPAPEPDEED